MDLPKRLKLRLKLRNEIWDHFERLSIRRLLAKCKICAEEIRVSKEGNMTRALRAHLLKIHDMFYDKGRTIPDNLRQYYLDLPQYEAKCNKCGKIISYLKEYLPLKQHLKLHPDLINQSQHETDAIKLPKKAKRSELWNHFTQIKHLLAKCTICEEEIRVSNEKYMIGALRVHLSNHQMFPDKNRTVPDKLRQYYSDLSEYKAKCNECGRIISYVKDDWSLKRHLKMHPDLINQHDTSSSTGNVVDPIAERQSQEPPGLLHVQSSEEMSKDEDGFRSRCVKTTESDITFIRAHSLNKQKTKRRR